jgi:hypothetical protein
MTPLNVGNSKPSVKKIARKNEMEKRTKIMDFFIKC